jgi:hypothetical protein
MTIDERDQQASLVRIGTLGEKSLHAALKQWYARPGDRFEVPVGGYHIDILRGNLLIEIQTRGFSSAKRKLYDLVDAYRVKLVHPIPVERWLVDLDASGIQQLSRRRSPKRGQAAHIFLELVRIPDLIMHPNFSLDVLLVHDEEIRHDDGKGSWRRGRRSISDRRLLEVVQHIPFERPADFGALLPADLPETFTTGDIAAGLKGRNARSLAGKMAYCLRKMGVIEQIDRRGSAYLYRLV